MRFDTLKSPPKLSTSEIERLSRHSPSLQGDGGNLSRRKEVIQPQVLLRLPCYDFTPIRNHTVGVPILTVNGTTSSTAPFRDVTGGVYKARERIHGAVLMRHY